MDHLISTKTINCKCNFRVDIGELYNTLPITPYVPIIKMRGRRSKDYVPAIPQLLEDGNIVTLKYKEVHRGVLLKTRKKSKNNAFGNSLIIVMKVYGKLINIKCCNNGRIQITGAKSIHHAIEFFVWLKRYAQRLLLINGPLLQVYCCTMMTNVNFSIGYHVDRIKLRDYINNKTPFHAHFEPCSEYTGVTIQIVPTGVDTIPVDILTFLPEQEYPVISSISLEEYVKGLPEYESNRENLKEHHVKFFVFQSGKILMTGTHEQCMIKAFDDLGKTLREATHEIKEELCL